MNTNQSLVKKIEYIFEFCLWNFRLFTIFPVIFGLLSALNFFILGSMEICHAIGLNFTFLEDNLKQGTEITAHIITGVDYYLVGVVLLIFSFGIYELFISKIDVKFLQQENYILEVSSLEELKHKLIQVIITVLIVTFFKQVILLKITGINDLFWLAMSILVIAISSYLMYLQGKKKID